MGAAFSAPPLSVALVSIAAFCNCGCGQRLGGLGGVVSTSFKKYLSTVRSSGSSSAQNCIKMIKTKKICGFVKPEALLLLKRSSRGEEGKTRMGRFTSKCSQFSHRVCCALNFFFYLRNQNKSGCTDSVENLRLNGAT